MYVRFVREILLQHWVLSRGKLVGSLQISGQRSGDFWF